MNILKPPSHLPTPPRREPVVSLDRRDTVGDLENFICRCVLPYKKMFMFTYCTLQIDSLVEKLGQYRLQYTRFFYCSLLFTMSRDDWFLIREHGIESLRKSAVPVSAPPSQRQTLVDFVEVINVNEPGMVVLSHKPVGDVTMLRYLDDDNTVMASFESPGDLYVDGRYVFFKSRFAVAERGSKFMAMYSYDAGALWTEGDSGRSAGWQRMVPHVYRS